MSWSLKLLETMKDPQSVVLKTEKLVAIKDKFPKAKHHFLILPTENLDTIRDLTKQHIGLVQEMAEMAHKVIDLVGQKRENFMIGFHAEPSMMRVHLHVISKDFISICLKTKSHWNSYHTSFLWPPSQIIRDLETSGKVASLSDQEFRTLLGKTLKCNACQYLAKNMPDLKKHLLNHESLYQ